MVHRVNQSRWGAEAMLDKVLYVINLYKPFMTSLPSVGRFRCCVVIVGFKLGCFVFCKFDLPKSPKMPNDPFSPTVSEVASQQYMYHSHTPDFLTSEFEIPQRCSMHVTI